MELSDGGTEVFRDAWPETWSYGLYDSAQIHSFVVGDDGTLRIYRARYSVRRDESPGPWDPVSTTPGNGSLVGVFPPGGWERVREV